MTTASRALDILTPPPRDIRLTGPDVSFTDTQLSVAAGCDSARPVLTHLTDLARLSGGTHRAPHEVLRLLVGAGEGSDAWRLAGELTGLGPGELIAEGYALVVSATADGPVAILAGADASGAFYAAQTLAALVRRAQPEGACLPQVRVRDWPVLAWRGTVEGFYGPPWTSTDRDEHLRFAGRHKLNAFVYAPKDDPYHRERWRDEYPTSELDVLRGLVATARAQHVRFVYALAPGLSMRYSDPGELALLVAKADQLWDAGVRDFALLFDDIPTELVHPEDTAVFGTAAGAAGAAHARVCTRFADDFLGRRGNAAPLSMCPTDYAGAQASPYREHLARDLARDVLVWWTGSDIVVGEVTRQDVDDAASSYGHRLLLWDNFPVNDFDRSRLFLGPLTGRTTDLGGSALAGIAANPMIEAAPSHLALASVAEYAWNPAGYDPAAAARRALSAVAGEHAEMIAPLVASCSSWPPSAPQSPWLSALTADVLATGPGPSVERLQDAFAGLTATADRSSDTDSRLVEQLGPWLNATEATGRAGGLALELLLAWHRGSGDVQALRERVRTTLAEAGAHEANVLRSVVPPFVHAVLEMTSPEGERPGDERA